MLMDFARRHGKPELLSRLALGQVSSSPFDPAAIRNLKKQIIAFLAEQGFQLHRDAKDRQDVPVDFRFLQLLLTASEDPETGLGDYASGVGIGPGARLPRLPALYAAKKRWKLTGQEDPADCLEPVEGSEAAWRKNYSTPGPFMNEVESVLEDQHKRPVLK